MLTGEVRTKIDNIWQSMWNNGMSNPLTNIMQITYLLFIKMLDDGQIKAEREANVLGINIPSSKLVFKDGVYISANQELGVPFDIDYKDLRWNIFKNITDPDKMYFIVKNGVFPFIKNLKNSINNVKSSFETHMDNAVFEIPKASILVSLIDGISDPELNLDNKDLMGDVYEYLLAKLAVNGDNGQFRTPKHIIEMMVKLVKPTITDVICDPAMGTGGFIVAASKEIRNNYSKDLQRVDNQTHFNNTMFYGYDTDPIMLRIGSMNMTLHGVDSPTIEYRDSLSENNKDYNKYSLILANPPFAGNLNAQEISKSLTGIVNTKKTELLFLALFLRTLKIGGRCASIVPVGVVNNGGKAFIDIRKELIENNRLEAVIYMPNGVFKPYAGVQTAILIFTKTNAGGTDDIWLYNMENDGFSLDDKRNSVEENDIPDIIERFSNLELEKNRTTYDKSFFINKNQIDKSDYSLSWNKYRTVQIEKKVFRKTSEIISSLEKLEKEYSEEFDKLKEMLKHDETK